MLGAKKLFVLLLTSLAVVASTACAAVDMDEEDDEDAEDEPAEQVSDELRSTLSCKERTDTAYARGKAYSIQVIQVGGKPVSKATGHAFLKMQAAAAAAGVRLSVNSGFRTQAEQTRLYDCYRTGACNNGNVAARPGYSNHQNGLALDLSTSTWLSRNASRFGFVGTVSREPWHYEYRGKDPGGPCTRGATTSLPATPGGDDVGGLTWVAPAQDSTLKNGFVVKTHANKPAIVKVVYSQGTLAFGSSTTPANDFALDYTFQYMGDKTLTARGYDASGALLAVDHVDFTLQP
jgi:LAS superfamily LD-carboxypeptidase LdcB